jgi:hypothetical protein
MRLENYETASTTKLNQQNRKKRTFMKTACGSRIVFPNPRVLIGFALYVAGLVLALAPVSSAVAENNPAAELSVSVDAQATGGTWTATGDLGSSRWRHTATLLPNDQVLVAGGLGDSGDLASAQLYHPAIGRWQRIADMNHTHRDHTATLLPNGQVLVAGGVGCNGAGSLGRCGPSELYDPTTRTWTDTGSLRRARWSHTATLLPNGQVWWPAVRMGREISQALNYTIRRLECGRRPAA